MRLTPAANFRESLWFLKTHRPTLCQAGAGNKKWSQLWAGPRCDVAEPDDPVGGGIKQIARGPVLRPPYARPTDSTVLWDT